MIPRKTLALALAGLLALGVGAGVWYSRDQLQIQHMQQLLK